MDLGRFYDLTAAKGRGGEVKLTRASSTSAHIRAHHHLLSARQVEQMQWRRCGRPSTGEGRTAGRRAFSRELRRRGGEAGKTTRRFLGSITHKGKYIWRFDSVDALCPQVYELADSWELAGEMLARPPSGGG